MSTGKRKQAALAAMIGVLIPIAARAFDGEAFTPAVDPQGYFSTYSSKTSPRNRFYLGFWYDYANEPLGVSSNFGQVGGPLIRRLHAANFVASYSLLDWLEIGVDVPVSYTESGDIAGVKDGFDIDNVKLNGKLQLIDPGTGGLGLALVPFVEFPTGDDAHLTSNGRTNLGGLGVAELVGRKLRASVNFGYKANAPFDNTGEDDELMFGAGLGYLLIGEQPILGADQSRLELLGEVFGGTDAKHAFKNELGTPTEFLAGGRFYHPSGIQLGVGGGRRITDGINGPDYRIVATVGYSWQPKPPPPSAPPPPPYPPQEKVVVTEEQIITLEPIYFDFDKSTIKPVSYSVLDQVVKVMNERPAMRVRVEGHTDSKGSDAYNQKLSQRRSGAVVKYLIRKGISPSRLEAIGYGESRPVAPNNNPDGSDNPTGRAKNRRTEFHVIK